MIRSFKLVCAATMLAMVAVAGVASSPASVRQAPTTVVVEFSNGRWFDGDGFRDGTWYSVDGALTQQRPRRVDRRHDLQGRYVVPPLAEAHNHNLQNAWGVQNFLARYRADGVQYAAMLCGNADNVKAARQALEAQSAVDVIQASACISSSDGHPLAMARRNPDGSLTPAEEIHDKGYIVMDSVEDIERKWPLVEVARPDLVKAILVHSELPERRGDPEMYGNNGLAPELLAPLILRAHREGLRVAVHVESAADFKAAVEAGADLVAHLPGYQFWKGRSEADYWLDDASITLAARRGIPVVVTAGAAELVARDDQAALARVQALQKENLQRLIAAGVPIAIGSDRFDGTSAGELAYLSGLEVMPVSDLLRAAVEYTPTLLFPGRRIGRIAEGYEANFLVLEADPIDDTQAFRRIALRLRRGEVY